MERVDDPHFPFEPLPRELPGIPVLIYTPQRVVAEAY